MSDPKGRAAVVTGSTSGIGLGIARSLAGAGVNIMLNGSRAPNPATHALREEIEGGFGVRAVYCSADLADPAQVRELVAVAEREFGTVDILVNNAGIQHVAPVDEFPDEKWEKLIALNLSSAFYAIKAVLPGMKRRNWGRIVNIASAHALVASPFKSAYVASKHGLLGLTKSVALETADFDITCNAICPGYVRTPLVEGQIEDQAKVHKLSHEQVIRDVILAAHAKKRFVEPEELGALTVLVCSAAGKSITGAALPVDGGWTAR
ncbi:MAG: 3-hydroxybutyrate dehydrogenase [Burkholderiales bacterium]